MVALPQIFRPNSVVDSAFNDAVGDFFGFDFEEDRIVDAGYSLIPCMPGAKMPAEYKNGRWIPMSGWDRYSKERPTPETIGRWMTMPNANVGIVLGTMCDDYQLVSLDFDTDHQDELNLLRSKVPVSPMSKRGARGYTAFYRAPADLRTKRYMIEDPSLPGPNKRRTILEVLTGNAPRQTVMPPSIHPNGNAYQWGSDCVSADEAEIVPVTELPILTHDHIEAIEDALRGIGWAAPAKTANASRNTALGLPKASNDERRRTPWRELNEIALQNLDAWVPALGLPRLRKRGNGYESVATWRGSNGGNPTEKRKLNLKFHVDGIKDMGSDDGYTPIDVICAWWNWTANEAFAWLQQKLGTHDNVAVLSIDRQIKDGSMLPNEMLDVPESRIDLQLKGANDNMRFMQTAWQPPPIFCMSKFEGLPVPPREFFVEKLIPKNKVTMLAGDGGTGKSLLALMLAVSAATGTSWLEFEVVQGPVVCLAAEDDKDEIHRRTSSILSAADLPFKDCGGFHVVPLVGEDAFLATVNRQTGLMEPTRLFGWLREKVDELRPSLLVLDTLADLYGGDEIKREQARSFVAMLNGLAAEFEVTILLLSHPSQSGMESGRGTSGSTAWSNSVRSRLYLQQDTNDPDRRTLTLMKTNHSKPGAKYTLRYDEGRFVREQISATAIDLSEAKAEFVRLMEEFARMGRELSSSPGTNYAPKLFSEQPGARFNRRRFADAMNVLFQEDKLCIVEEGPPSRRRKRLRLADASTVGADQSELDGGE